MIKTILSKTDPITPELVNRLAWCYVVCKALDVLKTFIELYLVK